MRGLPRCIPCAACQLTLPSAVLTPIVYWLS